MDCSSRTVSNTRPAPKAASSPLVTPYTPPLRPTSSPNTSMPGRAARASVSVALMAWARVSGPPDSGSRSPNAARRAFSSAAMAAPAATASGRRGASGPSTSAGSADHVGRRVERPGAGGLVAVQHVAGCQQAGVDEQPGGPDQGVGREVGGDLGGLPVGGLRVGTGVAAEPDHRQVQERGGAVL